MKNDQDKEAFERWWHEEGSGISREDTEESIHRLTEIAWMKGAYAARGQWQMWAMQREIDILKNLSEANRTAEEWRRKYHEARKYLRDANRGAQRNAMVAELAHARLSRPNNEGSREAR